MQLRTLWEFCPQKHALFLHPKNALLCVHESTDFIAAVTRNNEVVLHNTKTGRSSTLLKSHNGIDCLTFTHQYLLVVEHGVHQILVFSLRNEKLKKRITGHRSQITSMTYCRNTGLFASLSHDQLLLFSEETLSREKLLKCSTSSFQECAFSLSGNTLATVFADGSVFLWDTEDYSHRQSGLAHRQLKAAINDGSILAIFNAERLFLADLSKEVVIYQQIDKFWKGKIRQVNFIDGLLALNTDNSFYLADIQLEHQFIVKGYRQFAQTDEFAVAQYQSVLVLITNKLKTITIAKIDNTLGELVKTQQRNPLTNQGLVCAGGFSNTQGCFVTHDDILGGNNYQQVTQQIEKINAINYQPLTTKFSQQKLQDFIRKHHFLPDKHRPMAYRYLLKLPVSPQEFRNLQQKGRHQCVALLDAKYPLQNRQLAQAMKDILSLLAHYHPVFAQAHFIPTLIFPFVCLFGNDHFLCFEILYRLFTRPLSFLFKEFPVANSAYLQNVREILAKEDPELLAHFNDKGLSFTKTAWSLLSTVFSACLAREQFLAVIDSIFVRINEPEYVAFLLLGFLVYNRARILTIGNNQSLALFLQQEQSVHLGKFLGTVDKIAARHKSKMRYEFEVIDLQDKTYHQLSKVPADALKMYENKRKMLAEQLFKKHQQQRNRDDMLKQMETLAVAARREAERQAIERQAYNLHCQTQAKNTITFKPRGDRDRIARIEQLIDQLSNAIKNEQNTKQMLKNYLPSVTNLQVQSNQQLAALELKLSKLLGDIKPQQSSHWLKSQPIAIRKEEVGNYNGFKAAVNTRLAGQLWELERNSQANRMQKWQNNMLSSLNH